MGQIEKCEDHQQQNTHPIPHQPGQCDARENTEKAKTTTQREVWKARGRARSAMRKQTVRRKSGAERESSLNCMKQIYEADYGYKDVADRVERSYQQGEDRS